MRPQVRQKAAMLCVQTPPGQTIFARVAQVRMTARFGADLGEAEPRLAFLQGCKNVQKTCCADKTGGKTTSAT